MAGSAQLDAARRQFQEVWSTGALDVVDEIMSEDFVRHGPDLEGGQISGREGFKGLVTLFRTGLPDMDVPVDEIHEIGDRVIVRWRVVGTNTGGALGQAANGKRVEIIGQHVIRFADGQIVEEWVAYDTLGVDEQTVRIPQYRPGTPRPRPQYLRQPRRGRSGGGRGSSAGSSSSASSAPRSAATADPHPLPCRPRTVPRSRLSTHPCRYLMQRRCLWR